VDTYAAYNELLTAVQALYDVTDYTELVSGAHETLGTALSTAATDVEAATTSAEIETVTSTLEAAGYTYFTNAEPTGSAQFDLTYTLTNPDLTGLTTWAAADGWYTDQTGGNSQVMTNDGVAGSNGNAFYEYWSETAVANDKFTLYQKVTLPAGTYTINCDAFASANGVTDATTSAVYFYANDTQGSLVSNATLTASEISFVNDAEQEVKIGLKALTGNQYRWMGIGYVELYKVPSQSYTISEDATYDNTQSGAGSVSLTRTIKAGCNTLVLPFSMTQTELETVFGEGAIAYRATSYANDAISFTSRDGLSANEPVVLYAPAALSLSGTEIANRTIVAGTPSYAGTNVTTVGSYAESLTVPEDSYVISGGYLYLVNSTVALKGTRAYFNLTSSSSKVQATFDDGTETALENILANENANDAVYNLAGQRVSKAVNGLYIINGKKVLVK